MDAQGGKVDDPGQVGVGGLNAGLRQQAMGLAPVVGIPLPFISHGGSSMMTNMICIGTIMAVSRWQRGFRSLS